MSAEHGAENDQTFEVEVTIETTIESKARYQIDRRDFEEWAGPHNPADLPTLLKEYLVAGDDWEVCAAVYDAAGQTGDVADCEITRVVIPAAKRTDYLLDGSPESVAVVREARGLPSIEP